MILDTFLFSYDHEAVKLRLDVLKDVVDMHIAVQGDRTFQGEVRDPSPLPLGVVPRTAILSHGPEVSPWQREKEQRDACAYVGMDKMFPYQDTWVIVSDGDEIPHPQAIAQAIAEDRPMTLLTDARSWYANWRYPDDQQLVHQPVIGKVSDFMAVGGANQARWSRCWPTADAVGWHFSGLGDPAWQQRKVKTFAHAEHRNDCDDLDLVQKRRDNKMDFLGRFYLKTTIDLPKVDWSGKYAHLLG